MIDSLSRKLRRLVQDDRGNVAITTVLTLPVVIGALGLGVESASWMSSKRAMQNAADAAAIAAATNAGSEYGFEAQAVASQYGFKHGEDGVTVEVNNTAACPGAQASQCYRVTISRPMPLMLAQVVGYRGDATVEGAPAKLVAAEAVAKRGTSPREYCVLALAKTEITEPELLTHGAPKANLTGCSVMSNGDARCTGHDLGADFGDAFGTNDGCGKVRRSKVAKVTDPYEKMADNIPAQDGCNNTYPQMPAKKGTPLPPSNKLAGNQSWSGTTKLCGDQQLVGNVTITEDTTIYIYNGQLDTNGFKIQTAPGVSATLVFTGDNGGGYTHAPTGGGTIDITAPKSGPWQGMALYQDPRINTGVDISEAGNSPTWNMTGVAYLPRASVTFSGAVNKSSNGKSCFALVVDNLRINGTGSILAHGECNEAGVKMPTGAADSRGKLVS
ncbi:pilus assembly protein TadG-related protein [Phenylobacterium sp. LjRoot219]|uniref:pilus assembly protein TadG-related protein n=1 Tax=Phenylobacterium sp. LjRoot219 TaxID=3342283 RepID=UPI003ECD7E62